MEPLCRNVSPVPNNRLKKVDIHNEMINYERTFVISTKIYQFYKRFLTVNCKVNIIIFEKNSCIH